MKEDYLSRCRQLQQEFDQECQNSSAPGNHPQSSIRESESELLGLIDLLQGDAQTVAKLKQGIHLMALRARVNAARAEAFQAELGEGAELVSHRMAHRLDNMVEKVEGISDEELAAIEIEREMHTATGSMKDILKSLLMWKETPEERLRKRQAS